MFGELEEYLKDKHTKLEFPKSGMLRVGMAKMLGPQFCKRVYAVEGKSPTLTAASGGSMEPKYLTFNEGKPVWAKTEPHHWEMLQTVPVGYTGALSASKRHKVLGNGFTIDVISHILGSAMFNEPINVLSLFDGISAAQIALERAGIPVKNYYASEIDKYAITVAQENYPNTQQIGDVRTVDVSTLPKIDLIVGGSPCQGFSFTGKGLNFDDPRSALFFEYVRILNKTRETNPDVKFLLENVRMKKEYQDVISEHLGVQPVPINSSLVSAQNRYRLYWANWEITQPDDRGIVLSDIV